MELEIDDSAQRRKAYRDLAESLCELPGADEDGVELIKMCLSCAMHLGMTLPHELRIEAAQQAYQCADQLAYKGAP